jgi:hypothetical protein
VPDLLDVFYNGVLLSILLLWLLSERPKRFGRLISFAKTHPTGLVLVLWTMFLSFAVAYCLCFDQLADMHDIPNAVDSAVLSQSGGVNPYSHDVVPRFEGRYTSHPSWSLGPYNYLSLDLIVYYGIHVLAGGLGMPFWFVAANLMFSAAAFIILQDMVQVKWRFYAPIAGIAMLFFSFDNASLTFLLIVASMYLYSRLRSNKGIVATIVLGLAVMTKIYAIIPFVVFVLYELQLRAHLRDWRVFAKVSASVGVSGVIAIGLMLPFGIDNVIKSAVLFHLSAGARVGTSSGGTFLSELPLSDHLSTIISVALVMVSVIAALKLKSLNNRMLLVSLVLLVVVSKSSQALLVVPGLFLVLRMREAYLARRAQGGEAPAPRFSLGEIFKIRT